MVLLTLWGCAKDETTKAIDSGSGCAVTVDEALELSITPFVQVAGDQLRLRFETTSEVPAAVVLDGDDCNPITPTLATSERTYAWPDATNSIGLEYPDLPGTYTLQEVLIPIADRVAGERVSWDVHLGGDVVLSGSSRVPPEPGEPFRVAFVGDTMVPNSDKVFPLMAQESADVFLHGGDIQYQSIPSDTWSGLFARAGGVTSEALFHPCIGNHEYEGQDEEHVFYERLFAGEGTNGAEWEWYALDYGDVRFLSLNSESEEDLDEPDSTQIAWLEAQLEEVTASPDLTMAVVFFHRPIYTLARHAPSIGQRDVLHPLFVEHNVTLVLQGHNHAYERMVVDGITYIVDGGGGALLYDVDENVPNFPDEVELRKASSRTYGYTMLDFDGEGGVAIERFDIEGNRVDDVVLDAP